MMVRQRPLLAVLTLFVVVILVATGCAGLPDESKKEAEAIPMRIEELRTEISGRLSNFETFQASGEYGFYKPYAETENWVSFFAKANSELDRAQQVFEQDVKPILDRNKPEEADALTQQLNRMDEILTGAQSLSKQAGDRRAFLDETRAQAAEKVATAESQVGEIDSVVSGVESALKTAQVDYPQKEEDLAERFIPLQKKQADAHDALNAATEQLDIHRKNDGTADYALLGDSAVLVTTRLEEVATEGDAFHARIGELSQSYSKVLVDMRAEYYLEVGRTAWDNAYDFPTEHTHIYPATEVDAATWEYFVELPPEQRLGRIGSGWGGDKLTVDVEQQHWASLRVSDPKANWHKGDDEGEFWLSNDDVKTFHKYLVINGAEQEETEWEEVDPGYFEEHVENLGMTVVAKPYGEYEEDRIESATPVGMEYVGNPEYGEWRQDSDGRSFWHYYGQYAFFSSMWGPSHRYYRDDWTRWDRDYRGSRPYYGRDVNRPDFGTRGRTVASSTRFQNTTFNQRGGLGGVDSSVRNAGSSARGGGPGGAGK